MYAEIVQRPPAVEESTQGLLGYGQIIFRNKWKVLLLAALGAGIGYLAVLPQTPVYRASSSLEVLEVNNSFLNLKNLDPTIENYSLETRIHTEMKMLQAKSLVRQVQEKVLESTAPMQVNGPDPVSTFFTKIGLPSMRSQPTRLEAVQMAASSLQVRNQDLTRILEISCESTDPRTAAEFANILTQFYMDTTVEGRLDNAQRTRVWLDQQIEEIRQRLESSNTQLVAYAQREGLTLGTESADKLRKLQELLSTAEAEAVRKGVDYRTAKEADPNLLPEVQQDQELKLLKQELVERQTQLGEEQTRYAAGHYIIQRLNTQVADIKTRIAAAEQQIILRLESEFKKAETLTKVQSAAYEQQALRVSDQDRKMIRHNMLKREVETYSQLYDSMLQRVKEASIASAMRAQNVRVVDKAEVPKSPYKPQPARQVLTGMGTGLFLGIVLVILRSFSDHRFRAPGEASAFLHVRELGAIPSAAPSSLQKRAKRAKASTVTSLKDGQTGAPLTESLELATWAQNSSPQAESFRSVLVSLLATTAGPISVIVTSPNPGDGKTSVVANLGVALTELGKRVLLIDADLRRPRLHQVFHMANSRGLTDLVDSEIPLDNCVTEILAQPTEIPDLYILPSGSSRGNVTRVLHNRRMHALLTRLRVEFDVILIDTPPVIAYPDARILAKSSGGALVVVRAGVTDREVGRRAVQRLEDDGVEILGAILNDFDPKQVSNSYQYRTASYGD
jgi:capsular exopolysaccharide synthesis family protein